jgi:hypothetical protein
VHPGHVPVPLRGGAFHGRRLDSSPTSAGGTPDRATRCRTRPSATG